MNEKEFLELPKGTRVVVRIAKIFCGNLGPLEGDKGVLLDDSGSYMRWARFDVYREGLHSCDISHPCEPGHGWAVKAEDVDVELASETPIKRLNRYQILKEQCK